MEGRKKQHHFVLVHGACHGAWCWYKVVTSLRSEGHHVTALDMAACGADPRRPEEVTSPSDYFQPLMDFIKALPSDERVVLVGHSMGGIGISAAVEKFPVKIAVAVFVTAFMPGPRFAASVAVEELNREVDYMDYNYVFGNGEDQPPTSMLFGPDLMATSLYQLSPPEDLTLATLLLRPVPLNEMESEEGLSDENYGSIRRAFVVCEEDNILKKGFQEWMIQNNPVDEVMFISGADHMVMFSKPIELCSCLLDLAYKYNH